MRAGHPIDVPPGRWLRIRRVRPPFTSLDMEQLMKRIVLALSLFASVLATAGYAQETIGALGRGGPAPAMKEAAQAFESKANIKVEVTAGPTGEWIEQAKAQGDLIFSGSEVMMTDFVTAMAG